MTLEMGAFAVSKSYIRGNATKFTQLFHSHYIGCSKVGIKSGFKVIAFLHLLLFFARTLH